jgi:hypothetical protein
MDERSIEIRKRATEFFGAHEIGPDIQTRISLFLQGLKSINATVLVRVEFQAIEWLPYKYLHSQYFKEVELITLLAKATSWTGNPMVFLAATNTNLTAWQETGAARFMQGVLKVDRTFYEYLALSHALMSNVRFLPLLPIQVKLDTPFLSVLKEIEEENGRQIQTQIRLLKDMKIDLSRDEKEHIIDSQRQIVERIFLRLLCEICNIPADIAGDLFAQK